MEKVFSFDLMDDINDDRNDGDCHFFLSLPTSFISAAAVDYSPSLKKA
jgi:hypothetical protein